MSEGRNQYSAGHSARRRKFVLEYCSNGFRGSAAAIKAGYSKSSARQIAHVLLTQDDILRQVKEVTAKHFDRAQMGADETLARLSSMARADVRKFVDDDGNIIPVQDLDDDIARCVKKFKVTTITTTKGDQVTETETTELDVEARAPALAILARHHRLVEETPPPAPPPAALTPSDMIEMARRAAFLLARANAQVLDATPVTPEA